MTLTTVRHIVPGAPDQSVMTCRMASTDPTMRMPPLGTELPDDEGVAVLSEWIASLPASTCGKHLNKEQGTRSREHPKKLLAAVGGREPRNLGFATLPLVCIVESWPSLSMARSTRDGSTSFRRGASTSSRTRGASTPACSRATIRPCVGRARRAASSGLLQ